MKFESKSVRKFIYRASTIFSSGIGAAALAFWAFNKFSILGSETVISASVTQTMVAGMAALAAAGSAHTYFAGSDNRSKDFDEMTRTDAVTGVLSREGLEHAFSKIKSETGEQSSKARTYLLSMAFEELREINDSYNNETGDAVLKMMAKRLETMVGNAGSLGRTNGSEFIIILKTGHSEKEVRAAVTYLIDSFSKPIRIGVATYLVYANCGIIEAKSKSEPLEKLIRHANLARNNAKNSGRSQYAFYHPEMDHDTQYRHWLEIELNQALERDEFHIAYQPQIHAPSGKTIGYEALARWTHKDKGAISPEEFIAVAESSGFIQQLGNWILIKACKDALKLPSHLMMSVNVSTLQIQNDNFLNTLKSALEKTGLPPSRLEIEVTESVLIKDYAKMKKLFKDIHNIGVTIAIDDFGTGYSNLTNLSQLHFDKIKIDKSFVDLIGKSGRIEQLITTVVDLAQSFDSKIVAEGIEDEKQAAFLCDVGCTIMQGYYYGRPQTLASLLETQRFAAA